MKKGKLNQVGNFEKLVSFCTAQGSSYDPSMPAIGLVAMQDMLAKAQGSIEAADVSRTAYVNATNARQPVFAGIPRMASRVIAALKASGTTPELLEDAKTIKRRFQSQAKKEVRVITSPGQTTSPGASADDPQNEEVKFQRRLSQLDKDSMVGNFDRLVKLVASEKKYKPNEVELQVPTLRAQVNKLRNLNTNVVNAFTAMREADRALDNVLYGDGIHGTSLLVKNYIKSVHGDGSGPYREVTKLKFRSK